MSVPHLAFQLSIEEHHGYFQLLMVMNKAINKFVDILCGHNISTQLGKYLAVTLLDHMVGLCLP